MATETLQTYTAIKALDSGSLIPDASYSKVLLKMLMLNDFVFLKFGVPKDLPKNYGKTINFRRYTKLDPVATALTEGELPDSDVVAGSSITATVSQYGAYMIFSDLASDETFDDVIKEYLIAQAQQASLTLDNVAKKELATNGSPYLVNGATFALMDVADGKAVPTIDMFRKVALILSNNYIGTHEKGAGKYVVLVDDNTIYDLLNDTRMEKFMDYGKTNKPIMDNFVADVYNLRFIRNRNASTRPETTVKDGSGTASVTVHDAFVLGAEAYGVVRLGGNNVQVLKKALGSAGTADPLNQKQTIGWKINGFAVKILTPLAVQRVSFVPTIQ